MIPDILLRRLRSLGGLPILKFDRSHLNYRDLMDVMNDCVLNTIHLVRSGPEEVIVRFSLEWRKLGKAKERRESLGTAPGEREQEELRTSTAPSAECLSRLLSSQLPRRHPFLPDL